MRSLKFVWNVPNVLSLVRLLLIPVFAVLYFNGHIYWALGTLVLSGITDTLDGIIARKFNQITEVGKLLDPVADKITQVVVLVCMTIRTPELIPLFVICLSKELLQIIGGWILLSRNEVVRGSRWYGKVSTFTFYIAMSLIAFWEIPFGRNIPETWVTNLSIVVAVTMCFSFFMYLIQYIRLRRENAIKNSDKEDPQ